MGNITNYKQFRKFMRNQKKKYGVYVDYTNILDALHGSANRLVVKHKFLEDAMDKYRNTEYIYAYLKSIKQDVQAEFEYACAYDYETVPVSIGMMGLLTVRIQRFNASIGKIESALSLIDYMEKEELSIRKDS